jgi:hypothetical protein
MQVGLFCGWCNCTIFKDPISPTAPEQLSFWKRYNCISNYIMQKLGYGAQQALMEKVSAYSLLLCGICVSENRLSLHAGWWALELQEAQPMIAENIHQQKLFENGAM